MSAYDNDPRVQRVSDSIFKVNGCEVYATGDKNLRQWWVADRYGAVMYGPIPSADEAINVVVGGPR